jgi:hypothetical protein
MKFCIVILFLSICAVTASAQTTAPINLNGIWADSNSTSFQNCYLIIAQEGEKINMSHYLEFNGTPMVEYGTGKYGNGKVYFEVKVSKAIPGWATTGKHFLMLSNDGKTLRGEYEDDKGNRGPLVFKRILK